MKTAPLPQLRKTGVGTYETQDGKYRAVACDLLEIDGFTHPEAYWVFGTYEDPTFPRKAQDLQRARYFVKRHQETGA